MVSKNQESCESWLFELWVSRGSKMPKISVINFFWCFLVTTVDLLISLKYWIFLFLMSYQEKFQLLNIIFPELALPEMWSSKSCKILSFSLFGFEKFLVIAQKSFCIILSLYVVEHVEKIQVWISCLPLISKPPKSWWFFGKMAVEQVSKSFSGRLIPPEPSVFGFSNNLLYCVEESRELRALTS